MMNAQFMDVDPDLGLDFTDYNSQRYQAAIAAHRRQQDLVADAHQAAAARRTPSDSRRWTDMRCLARAIRRRWKRMFEPAAESSIA